MASNPELLRTRVLIERDKISNVSPSDYPHHYPGVDNSWSLENFKNNFKAKINRMSKNEMEFDLIGIDASIANAFRRILIAEVPTMAIEMVYIMNNTSIIQDEVLAHRLGLIPVQANPTLFDYKNSEESPTDLNTIVFKLKIKCDNNPDASPDEQDPQKKYKNSNVYSGDLIWEPKGDQIERFKDDPIKPVLDDILIAKLRPGQELDIEMHCTKATASYRLLPEIILKKEITGDLADKFAACFAEGVVEVVTEDGVKKAKVVNPRKDTVSREVLRHSEFQDIVKLTRVRDHFIFNIESTGAILPQELFLQAIQVLIEKAKYVKVALANVTASDT
ncbi:DNA-directed RNA polymerase [Jimgerdemannia flammicorona]|uniref:DNA-directed RNA polymerases I and III subunit RPAC1 n=1 Tax=Jimgerdemannia flammicorona TaxID=994334 RepID=A0A433QA27_9FUNG|nr:DNA-directed RNA polymerase [Jimgerdemannia flammicorona]